MSRFHDEFFKSKGTDHDNLLIKCLSEENLRKISGDIPLLEFPKKAQVLIYDRWGKKDVAWMIGAGSNWAERDRQKILEHGQSIDLISTDVTNDVNYETEIICRNGNFIIGYADLLISISQKAEVNAEFQEFKFNEYYESAFYTLVEVKPKLNDIGAAIRQLKTYHHILKMKYQNLSMVIVSGENVPENTQNFLEHEKIRVLESSEL
jgi:hypothetical protein